MGPELLFIGEKLTEALEELAVFNYPVTTALLRLPLRLGLLLLPGGPVDGAVENSDALLE